MKETCGVETPAFLYLSLKQKTEFLRKLHLEEQKVVCSDQNKLLVVWTKSEMSGHVYICFPFLFDSLYLSSFARSLSQHTNTHLVRWHSTTVIIYSADHFKTQTPRGGTKNQITTKRKLC